MRYGLGQPIGDIFARFDEMPLTAASVAQVHTAALHDGREVVVKVVRPISNRASSQTLSYYGKWRFGHLHALKQLVPSI